MDTQLKTMTASPQVSEYPKVQWSGGDPPKILTNAWLTVGRPVLCGPIAGHHSWQYTKTSGSTYFLSCSLIMLKKIANLWWLKRRDLNKEWQDLGLQIPQEFRILTARLVCSKFNYSHANWPKLFNIPLNSSASTSMPQINNKNDVKLHTSFPLRSSSFIFKLNQAVIVGTRHFRLPSLVIEIPQLTSLLLRGPSHSSPRMQWTLAPYWTLYTPPHWKPWHSLECSVPLTSQRKHLSFSPQTEISLLVRKRAWFDMELERLTTFLLLCLCKAQAGFSMILFLLRNILHQSLWSPYL